MYYKLLPLTFTCTTQKKKIHNTQATFQSVITVIIPEIYLFHVCFVNSRYNTPRVCKFADKLVAVTQPLARTSNWLQFHDGSTCGLHLSSYYKSLDGIKASIILLKNIYGPSRQLFNMWPPSINQKRQQLFWPVWLSRLIKKKIFWIAACRPDCQSWQLHVALSYDVRAKCHDREVETQKCGVISTGFNRRLPELRLNTIYLLGSFKIFNSVLPRGYRR